MIKNAEAVSNFALYSRTVFNRTCPLEFFNVMESNEDVAKDNYLEILVPLLHETWLEAVPEEKLLEARQGRFDTKNEHSFNAFNSRNHSVEPRCSGDFKLHFKSKPNSHQILQTETQRFCIGT